MAPRSKLELLPDDPKKWLNEELIRRGYSQFQAITVELAEKGVPTSKSAVGRYSKKFQEQMASMTRSTEMAKAVVSVVGDEAGARNEAGLNLLQEQFFTVLRDTAAPLTHKQLTEFAHAFASLTRASVQQKGWALKVRKEDAAKLAKLRADAEVASKAGKKGLDLETLTYIEKTLYGF